MNNKRSALAISLVNFSYAPSGARHISLARARFSTGCCALPSEFEHRCIWAPVRATHGVRSVRYFMINPHLRSAVHFGAKFVRREATHCPFSGVTAVSCCALLAPQQFNEVGANRSCVSCCARVLFDYGIGSTRLRSVAHFGAKLARREMAL